LQVTNNNISCVVVDPLKEFLDDVGRFPSRFSGGWNASDEENEWM
jgi:hypothetical protein